MPRWPVTAPLTADTAATVCCRAPELVPPAAASLAGDIMVLFLIAGLNLGAGLGFLWLLSDSA